METRTAGACKGSPGQGGRWQVPCRWPRMMRVRGGRGGGGGGGINARGDRLGVWSSVTRLTYRCGQAYVVAYVCVYVINFYWRQYIEQGGCQREKRPSPVRNRFPPLGLLLRDCGGLVGSGVW